MKYICDECKENAKPCEYNQTQNKGRVIGSSCPPLCPWSINRVSKWKRADGNYQQVRP